MMFALGNCAGQLRRMHLLVIETVQDWDGTVRGTVRITGHHVMTAQRWDGVRPTRITEHWHTDNLRYTSETLSTVCQPSVKDSNSKGWGSLTVSSI